MDEKISNRGLGWVLAGLLACAGCGGRTWCRVPPRVPGGGGGLEMGRCEVTVGEFLQWLRCGGEGTEGFPETAQLERDAQGRWRVRSGVSRRAAVSEVTKAEAEAYAGWRSTREGREVRLPTAEEWDWAARGGVRGAPWPWGWGGNPRKMARVDALAPAPRAGMHPANGYGLRDMAGNLFEWTADGDGARGGAWSEPDTESMRIGRGQRFPEGYRGRDVGFRLVRGGRRVP